MNNFFNMLKVKLKMIASHYGKHIATIKARSMAMGGIKTFPKLIDIVNFYENKKRKKENN